MVANCYAVKSVGQEIVRWGDIEECDIYIRQNPGQGLTMTRIGDMAEEFMQFLEKRIAQIEAERH